jgi:hypothetical protein
VTSNVTYAGINENFPVAGQDNDTKVFRDNFATIKTGLRNANEEITALQDNTAKTNASNDFQLNIVQQAVLLEPRDKKFEGQIYGGGNIAFGMGSYQVWSFDRSWSDIKIEGLPGDTIVNDTTLTSGAGKIRLELYTDGTGNKSLSFITTAGTIIKRSGFPAGGTDQYKLDVEITSNTNPIIIDVWRHSKEVIFFHYVGEFS